MSKFGVSQSVRRIEDHRFLTGQGRYVDDITPEGALFVTYLRSPVAGSYILKSWGDSDKSSETIPKKVIRP